MPVIVNYDLDYHCEGSETSQFQDNGHDNGDGSSGPIAAAAIVDVPVGRSSYRRWRSTATIYEGGATRGWVALR